MSVRSVICILILTYSFCSYGDENTYRINIHIFKRSALEPFLYRAVHQASATSTISRMNISFHSNTNLANGTETFALDHCLNPREKSPRGMHLILSFRSIVKNSERSCQGGDFFDLHKLVKIILSNDAYVRLTQHSDKVKMFDGKEYGFHSDFKYGDPANPKKLKSGIKIFKSNIHKNFASRLNRWFAHSSVIGYVNDKKTMKFIGSSDYHDFLLGSNCSFAIIEVSISNPATGTNNAGLLFYNFSSEEVLMIEIQSSPDQCISHTAASATSTNHTDLIPDRKNYKQACCADLTSHQWTQ